MKKMKILPVTLILSIVLLVGTSFAWFFAEDSVINYFKTEQPKIDIKPSEPGFENNKDWDGTAKAKPVIVTNTEISNVDVLIRVNLTPRWVERGTNNSFDGDIPFAGDINLIDLVYDQVNNNWDVENKWVDGNDGYYYYKTKVSPNNSTKALLKEVKVKDGKTIPDEYSGKDFIVDVNVESVVADKDSFKKIWNITDENSNVYKLLSNIVGN